MGKKEKQIILYTTQSEPSWDIYVALYRLFFLYLLGHLITFYVIVIIILSITVSNIY